MHHSKRSKCLLLALRHVIKQSRHWCSDWSMKLCWLLTTFQSDAASAHGHTSLVSDKHNVPAFRFQSVSPGAGALVWFSCSQGWKVHGAYYCDVLLLKQLLPDICQAAGDFLFPAHHACARALSCCDTRLQTSHQTWPSSQQTRPQFCRLQIIESHLGMRLSETARDVKHRWWAVVISRKTFY